MDVVAGRMHGQETLMSQGVQRRHHQFSWQNCPFMGPYLCYMHHHPNFLEPFDLNVQVICYTRTPAYCMRIMTSSPRRLLDSHTSVRNGHPSPKIAPSELAMSEVDVNNMTL